MFAPADAAVPTTVAPTQYGRAARLAPPVNGANSNAAPEATETYNTYAVYFFFIVDIIISRYRLLSIEKYRNFNL
jgi:hypothetical protein